jgi:hypothetical protein
MYGDTAGPGRAPWGGEMGPGRRGLSPLSRAVVEEDIGM